VLTGQCQYRLCPAARQDRRSDNLRIARNVESTIRDLQDPASVVDVGIDALWLGSIEEPELPRAYLALLTSAGESLADQVAVRAHDLHIQSFHRKLFTRRRDQMA